MHAGMVGFCFAEGSIECWEDMDTITILMGSMSSQCSQQSS